MDAQALAPNPEQILGELQPVSAFQSTSSPFPSQFGKLDLLCRLYGMSLASKAALLQKGPIYRLSLLLAVVHGRILLWVFYTCRKGLAEVLLNLVF